MEHNSVPASRLFRSPRGAGVDGTDGVITTRTAYVWRDGIVITPSVPSMSVLQCPSGIGPKEALLWTHGSVRGISQRAYFQGARSTPRPLRLVRHAGHGPWDESAFAILALSKMDWNNDALYDPLPVTLEYAKTLARVVKRMNVLGSAPYQFGFFM
jgi:hypothetical protein